MLVKLWFGRAIEFVTPTAYALGGGPVDLAAPYDENNKLTSSRVRLNAKHDAWRSDASIRNGAATYRWAIEAVDASRKLRADAGTIRTPMLILQAQNDELVNPDGHNEVCAKVNAAAGPGACTLEVLAGSRHEGLFEVDKIRKSEA